MVAPTATLDVVDVDSQMSEAEAIVAAHLRDGGTLHYEIKLERDVLGWKISDLNLIFASQQH
jgi:hypothetical protein